MTFDGKRRTNRDYGDSPVRRSRVPIASSRLASSTRGTASRLPFGSAVESWPPQPSACPRPSPHAVPRVGDASCERRQSRAGAPRRSKRRHSFLCERRRWRRIHSAMCEQRKAQPPSGDLGLCAEQLLNLRRSREGTLPALPRTRLVRSIGRGRPTRLTTPDESADNWGAGSASLPPRPRHADHAPE